MSLLRPYSNAMGIDVSDQVLRMIQLTPHRGGFALRSISARPLPEGAIIEGEIRNQSVVADVVRDLIAKPHHRHPSSRAAVISLPERKTFTKIIDVVREAATPFEASLKQGLAQNIPIKLDEAYIDWQYVAPPNTTDTATRVIVSAAPQLLVEGYVATFQAAGILPIILEPESAAIARVSVPSDRTSTSHMIVDLGATRTGLVITEGDLVAYASTMPLSGNALTKRLQEQLGLTAPEAEQAKRICGLDPKRGKGVVRSLLEAEFRPLSQRMLEVVSFYEEHAPKNVKVRDVTLVGGGSQLIGLDALLSSTLGLPVRVAAWPEHIEAPSREVRAVAPSYMTALGLALRGASSSPLTAPKNV